MSAISTSPAQSTHTPASRHNQLRRNLILLAIIGMSFGVLHHLDHSLRGNHIGWPLTADINPFTFSLFLYPLALMGLYFSLRGRLVPGYWLVTALIGFGLISVTHFGPQAIEPLRDITTPYSAPLQYIQTAPASHVAFFRDIYGPLASPIWAGVAIFILFGLMFSLAALAATAVQAYRATGKWWSV